MLKRLIPIIFTVTIADATNISTLLRGVENHYKSQMDTISIEEANSAIDIVHGQLYPKISIFGSFTHYNSPTNLRPTTPTENAKYGPPPAGDGSGDFPFSRDISRYGATLSMPIFVDSIFWLSDRAKAMRESAVYKREVNLLQDKATIIGANANLRYLEELKSSLNAKKRTLNTTKKIIKAKLKTGRASASALYKIKQRIDSIDIAINNIDIQRANIQMLIATLSGINIKHSVNMRKRGKIYLKELLPLKPLKAKMVADSYLAEAEKAKLYPSIHLKADYNEGSGDSYFSGNRVHKDYGSIGIVVSAPLLDMPQIRTMQQARIKSMKSAIEVAKLKDELLQKSKMLKKQLHLINRSITLHKKDINNQKKLVSIAKESYKSGRMTLEEYLRYIDALYEAKANLYKSKALYWQTLSQLAFIYGNSFERIVK